MIGLIRARRSTRALLAIAALAFGASGATAQFVDCSQLQTQIASMGRGDPAAAGRAAAALRQQMAELERTRAYGRSLGCGQRQFLFFGGPPPPQCGPVDARVIRMQSNVAQLQAQVERADGEGQRRDLRARFDAYCRNQPRSNGFFDALFGGGGRTQMPLDAGDEPLVDEPAGDGYARAGSKAVCVRACDGGFFPIASARRATLGDLDDLCRALCPNAQASLYTYAPASDIDHAVSTAGEPYTALPNAGKYRTKFDPTCSCKPPHQSWVEALANAEQMLGREQRKDGPLTAAEADEMSRPQARKPTLASTRAKPGAPDEAGADPSAREAQASAQAPTAGSDSANIGGAGARTRSYGLSEGAVREEKSAEGVTRRVRTIGPTF